MWHSKKIRLIGSDAVGRSQQGYSAAMSADGNTALIGGPGDNGDLGAVWVFTRSEGVWRQQGGKLVGAGAAGNARQGSAVALSGDGDTAIVSGVGDDGGAGAVWVFTRNGGVWSQHWSQQGNKLVGAGAAGKAKQGYSIALSSDGNTLLVGGPYDSETGTAWAFPRTDGVWSQQGDKLAGSTRGEHRVYAIVLSAEGDAAVVGGSNDPPNQGAPWQFTRGGSSWRKVQSQPARGSSSLASLRPLGSTQPDYFVEIIGDAETITCPVTKATFDDTAISRPVSDGKSAGGVCGDDIDPTFVGKFYQSTVFASAGRDALTGGSTSATGPTGYASVASAKATYDDVGSFYWGNGPADIGVGVNAHVTATVSPPALLGSAYIALTIPPNQQIVTPLSIGVTFDYTPHLAGTVHFDECPCHLPYQLLGFATGTNGAYSSFSALKGNWVCTPECIHGDSVAIDDLESVVSFVLPEGMTFSLASQDAAATTVTPTTGTPQTTATGSVFSTNLQVTVLDANGVPIPHADVTFAAPSSGPTGTFPGGALTADVATDDSGVAISPTFTANTTAGAFSVAASAGTATPASFALTNRRARRFRR